MGQLGFAGCIFPPAVGWAPLKLANDRVQFQLGISLFLLQRYAVGWTPVRIQRQGQKTKER